MTEELVLTMIRLAYMSGWLDHSAHDEPEHANLRDEADKYAISLVASASRASERHLEVVK